MAGKIREDIHRPPDKLVNQFSAISPTIASDVMDRLNAMVGEISPLSGDTSLTGTAVTVEGVVGDNTMAHKAISYAEPGDVIVIDAKAHDNTAVWGEMMTKACVRDGIEGVVIDGAIRDIRENRESDFNVFCRGSVPAGPTKGEGGRINFPIQAGGVRVDPGDIVLGSDDGVVIVPREQAQAVLSAAKERKKQEVEWSTAIENGESTINAIGLESKVDESSFEYVSDDE